MCFETLGNLTQSLVMLCRLMCVFMYFGGGVDLESPLKGWWNLKISKLSY